MKIKNSTIINRHGVELIGNIKKFYPLYGSFYCIKNFNLTHKQIGNIVSSLRLKMEKRSKPKKKYFIYKDLLKNPIKEFAYILGYIWGDGYISKKIIKISISGVATDLINIAPLLEKIGNWYYFFTNPKYKHTDGIKRKPKLIINSHSKDLYSFLVEKKYLNKKDQSAKDILDFLPIQLQKYWWRGFFDADGHITFKMDGYYNQNKCIFSLSSSYQQDWDFFVDLCKNLDIKKYEIYKHISKNGHKNSQFRLYNFDDTFKFLNYIYSDYDYIGYGRKYFQFIKMKECLEYRKKNPYFFGGKDIESYK